MHSTKRDFQARQKVIQLAVKSMVQLGLDYESAKRSAMKQLGLTTQQVASLPSHQELKQALIAHQQLFHDPHRLQHLHKLRESAYRAMQFLRHFNPFLTGMVLDGTAMARTPITLLAFSLTSEDLTIHLVNNNVTHELSMQKHQLQNKSWHHFPCFHFFIGKHRVDTLVLPEDSVKFRIRCPIEGEVIKRASLEAVAALLGPVVG